MLGSLLALSAASCFAPVQAPLPPTPAPQSLPQAPGAIPVSTPLAGSSVIAGSLNFTPPCQPLMAQLYLLSGASMVYQTSVTPGGTFEMHVAPGQYTLSALGQPGCSAQVAVIAQPNQVTQQPVSIVANGVAGGVTGAPPLATYPQNPYPYPCVWNGYGCTSTYYPGHGGGVVGKPNVYVSGPEGAGIRMQVRPNAKANLLVAVPAHGVRGWAGRLNRAGELVSRIGAGEETRAPYWFYDLRFDPEDLQAQQGTCVARANLIAELLNQLQNLGFLPREIEDFRDFWSTKIPPGESFCIYPQLNSEIDRIAELQITPEPKKITRVWFFVVPEAPAVAKAKTLQTLPLFAERWTKQKPSAARNLIAARIELGKSSVSPLRTAGRGRASTSVGTQRAPASAANSGLEPKSEGESEPRSPSLGLNLSAPVEVREWGVGFLMLPPTPGSASGSGSGSGLGPEQAR